MDIAGDTPTVHQAAQMAEDSYLSFDKRGKIDGGWTRLESYRDVKFEDLGSDFQSALYSRTIDGKTEFTYATVGTASGKDWANNFSQPVGSSAQYDFALTEANRLVKYLGGQELTFTGHSLGGGTASLNALVTGKAAITFNAAGLSFITESKYGSLFNKRSNIQAFVIPGEAVDYYQRKFWFRSVGNRIWVHPVFGKMSSLTAAWVKNLRITAYARYRLHLMDAMNIALDQAGYKDKALPQIPPAEQDAYDMQGSYMWQNIPVNP